MLLHLFLSILAITAKTALALGATLFWTVRARSPLGGLAVPVLALLITGLGYPLGVVMLRPILHYADWTANLVAIHPFTALFVSFGAPSEMVIVAMASGVACIPIGCFMIWRAFERFARTPSSHWIDAR